MICPECNGVGGVQVRFLLFFTRRARCRTCLGTGQFPPPRRMANRPAYQDDDDRYDDRRTVVHHDPTPSIMSGAAPEAEPLEIGRGGASGGAGGGASWDAVEEREAPVIVDPFASEVSSSETAAVVIADEAIEADTESSTPDDSAYSDSSSGDSGTAY
jgi:hypothetical protein